MDNEEAVIVEPPLSGEWVALQTPAERVPSHGTNYLGQRFAYDFVQLNPRSQLPYDRGFLRHLLARLPAESFLCWDQPVYSVFDGTVTAVGTGWRDHPRVNLIAALLGVGLAPPEPDGTDIRPLAGNYVIVQGHAASAFYAHLRDGSIAVSEGQQLRTGDLLGRIGNSGNSTMPHLHFHLMDRPDILNAAGVLCRFSAFEQFRDGAWIPAANGVPTKLERIRWRPGG